MDAISQLIQEYGGQLSAIGAAVAFIVGIYKFTSERKEAHFWKEFDVYHKLIKELVQPNSKEEGLYVDRQAAILFELRFFPRYYAYSLRMLLGLRQKWGVPEQFPRLLEELDLTIKFLRSKLRDT